MKQDMIASFNKGIEEEDTQPTHPHQDLEKPQVDLLDLINGQNHSEDQLDQALQNL